MLNQVGRWSGLRNHCVLRVIQRSNLNSTQECSLLLLNYVVCQTVLCDDDSRRRGLFSTFYSFDLLPQDYPSKVEAVILIS